MQDSAVGIGVSPRCKSGSIVMYLLSVFFLLLGAYLSMRLIRIQGMEFDRFYPYMILEIYEILLLGICWYVLGRLRLREDGYLLAGLGVLLFLDPTFFNNAFYSGSLEAGLIVNVPLLCAAFLKIYFLHLFGAPFNRRFLVCAAAAVIFIYLYPIIPSRLNAGGGGLWEALWLGLWWMPAVLALVAGRSAFEKDDPRSITENFNACLTLMVLFVMVSHLVESLIGYSVPFNGNCLSPLFFTLALLLMRLKPEWKFNVNWAQGIWLLSLGGVIASLNFSHPGTFTLERGAMILGLGFGIWINIQIAVMSRRRGYMLWAALFGAKLFIAVIGGIFPPDLYTIDILLSLYCGIVCLGLFLAEKKSVYLVPAFFSTVFGALRWFGTQGYLTNFSISIRDFIDVVRWDWVFIAGMIVLSFAMLIMGLMLSRLKARNLFGKTAGNHT